MNSMQGVSGSFPASAHDLRRVPPYVGINDGTSVTSLDEHCDSGNIAFEEQAEWHAVLESDRSSTAESMSADWTDSTASTRDGNAESPGARPPAIPDVPASDFSYAGNTSDQGNSRPPPSTQFEMLLANSTSLQVDWSKQSTQWSLCLRTTDTETFAALSRSKNSLSAALETGFGHEVAVQVIQE